MRRASIVGPLLLIGIGALLLINNLRPDLSMFGLFLNNWPYLLIIWGVARLIEITSWAFRGKPLPVNGISGGEWGLVVFLTLICSGGYYVNSNRLGLVRGPWNDMFAETYTYPVAKTAPVGKAPRIFLYNMRGDSHITGADVNEIRVIGNKTIRSLDKAKADEAAERSPVEVEVKGDQVFLRANEYRAGSDGEVSYDLQITVPRGATIEGHGRYGDFEISDISGGVEIQSDNAGVRLQNIGGDVKVDTGRSDIIRAVNVKGAVELKGRGDDVELDTISGQVTINGRYSGDVECRKLSKSLQLRGDLSELRAEGVPGQLKIGRRTFNGDQLIGPVVLTSRSMDVTLGDFTQSVEINVQRGDLDLRPTRIPLGKIDAKTYNGRVDLALPDSAKFDLRAQTNRGDIENDYGTPLTEESQGNRAGTLRGQVGQGPNVSVFTARGDIAVRKGGEVPPAAAVAEAQDEEAPPAPKAPKAPKAPVSPSEQ